MMNDDDLDIALAPKAPASAVSAGVWSMANRPEETLKQVPEAVRRIAGKLLEVAEMMERPEADATKMELELRLQSMWLSIEANKWQDAVARRARLLFTQRLMERRVAQ
ncbi:hypothetical protein [Prosthecobacter sp.]|uniref:hypothetical protein n=1 Tax=Prosthecobacter sp. TaxID=1965333 RepID=UPI003782EB6F